MTATPTSLEALLTSVASGDQAAFARLYQLTSPKLYAIALRILRSRESAEEVLQEAFFKVWERAREFDLARGSAFAWLTTIVRNRSLDELRRRAARPVAADGELPEVADDRELPLETLGRQEDVSRLIRCIEGLEPERQQMVRLAYLDGLSRDELAARFKHPVGTIKTWLRRSLAQLKGCLEQ